MNRPCFSRRHFLGAGLAGLAAPISIPAAPPTEYSRGGMVYRRLGNTGMDVSLLSFGSHTPVADRVRVNPSQTKLTPEGQARRDRIITRAFDRGVNLLDVYESEGQWEPASRLVKGRRDKVLVSLAHEVTPAELDQACRMFGHIDLFRLHSANIDGATLERWDLLRRAKEAGKIRAIGLACHIERVMLAGLNELEGLDYLFFPYNFIHARADYSEFLPKAIAMNVGLIGMKPLASGSIVQLDPRARPGSAPEFEKLQLWQTRNRPILPAAVAELTRSLERLPDETLCMAAMRFVYNKRFLSTAITGMFDDQWFDDNYLALTRYRERKPEERAALDAAGKVAALTGSRWLPHHYRWLDRGWRA
jgi:aryl-alcohol dehydrogenase-like predicted oxidoreductase